MYLSEAENLNAIMEITGLAIDELETIVGRFAKHSHRAGKLRGQLIVDEIKGKIQIVHSFTKKKLWEMDL